MENVYFVSDSFVDYRGDEHRFTIAAVVTSEPQLFVSGDYDNDFRIPAELRLSLGIAICNTKDEWDSKKGEAIAEGRARKYADDTAVITSKAMKALFSDDCIQSLLDNEVAFVKTHPGKFIPGYYEAEEKYKREEKVEALIAGLPEEELVVYTRAKEGKLSSQFIELIGLCANK